MSRLHRRRITTELTSLRQTLEGFDRSLRRLTPLLSAGLTLNGVSKEDGRSRPRLSAKARASMVLQGRDMGCMRQLKPSEKAKAWKMRAATCANVVTAKAGEYARA